MAPMLTIFEESPADLLREHRMYYLLVNSISQRVRQLQLGEKALAAPPDGHRDAIRVACQEFLEGQLEIIPKANCYNPTEHPEGHATPTVSR